MTHEQQALVDHIKGWLDSMTLEQLKAVKVYAEECFECELRTAAEGMVAAFDERPSGEPSSITQTTREAALSVAKQILGWPEPEVVTGG